jgi:signal transduction histidine kinase
MRLGLRWRILIITVLTPLSLGLAAWVTMNRNVNEHVDSSSIHESLDHAVVVFESMLAARGRALAGGAEVIARDPRFFSLLTLGRNQRDSRFTATLRGMARDFNRITQTDLFEVVNRNGVTLASVGSVKASPEVRRTMVREALNGKALVGIVVQDSSHYQVGVTPVRSDGRIVGALLMGSEIGGGLARVLRGQMRCEVTFLSGNTITTTTLASGIDRQALLSELGRYGASPATDFRALGVLRVRGEALNYLTVIRRIPSSDAAGMQLYVVQRALDPEVLFLQQMQRDLGLLGVIAVAAALLTGVFLSGNITRPVQQLVRAAQEMQRGNYRHPVNVRRKDEIGYLAERFQEMRQREQVYVSGLEEAERLKSEFISVASHELRTPISVIQGYRDLLAGGSLGPVLPSQKQALDAIRGSLETLIRIAERATQVSQVKGERLALELEPQKVGPILDRAAAAALSAATARKVRVEIQVDPALEPYALDGKLMEQAVTNLISNSIRFTPDGGRVAVHATERDGQVEIQVTDEGPGIPGDRLGQIFDHGHSIADPIRHHSSEELEFNSRGLGLGLGITRGVIEAHGGTISAGNRPEGGSQFVIRIPPPDRARPRQAAA